MPIFNDSENIPPVAPEGDYVFCVTDFESKISNGAKTRGCDQYVVEFTLEPVGNRVIEYLTDHENTSWKIDCFLKSAGVKLAKGEKFEFQEDRCKPGVRFVDPIGLRGWCHIIQDTLPPTTTHSKELIVNKIAVFYTDREKLAPRRVEVEEEANRPF